LETPHAIARAYFDKEAYLQPWAGYVSDVYTFAKRDIKEGEEIDEAIGSDLIYGMVATVAEAEKEGWVPQCLLDSGAVLKNSVSKDEPLKLSDVSLLDKEYTTTYFSQHGLSPVSS